MYRGTTPTLNFILPFAVNTIEAGYISLVQNRETVIEKSIFECELEEKTIRLKLSQTDTLQLDDHTATEIQLRIRLTDGTALASKIFTVSTDRILRDGVI